MIRLTVRSPRDGRLLVRIVDRDGHPFVLDFGDRDLIEDASQRIQHGFSVLRFGEHYTAPPQDPRLVGLLADHYLREGLLVAYEEPTWPGRPSELQGTPPGDERGS